jgi:hypothetical protein
MIMKVINIIMKRCIYLGLILQTILLPLITKAGEQRLSQLLVPTSECAQEIEASHHIAALAVDPFDGKAKILLSQAARGYEYWGLFKSFVQQPTHGYLEKILAHQTAEFYSSMPAKNYLCRCGDVGSGQILHIISVAFVGREVLLTNAVNNFRKNFYWVPVEEVIADSEAITSSHCLNVGQVEKIKLDRDFLSLFMDHKQEIKTAADDLKATAECTEKRICVSNHLNESLKDIKIVTDDSVAATLDCLDMLKLQHVKVSPGVNTRFWVQANFMGYSYWALINKPIRSIDQLVFEHDVENTGAPFLAYASMSDETTEGQVKKFCIEPLIKVECPSDMVVNLCNVNNLDISKITIQDAQGRVVSGIPSEEKAKWSIPTYKNQDKYYLQIYVGDKAYSCEFTFLSSSCELMIIKDTVTDEPTLFLRLEGEVNKVPLIKVEPSVPDMVVMLFNANIDISKITIQDAQGRVVSGMPSEEKAKWSIPTYKNQDKYYLQICVGDKAYLWEFKFLSSSCELMIIKDTVTNEPTLSLRLEDVIIQKIKVPLIKVERSVPDMVVMLFNANIDISKIKIQDAQGRIVRGTPSEEKAKWLIPTYKNQDKYYLEICVGDKAYLWEFKFLSSSCELTIIKNKVTDEPTLFLRLEDAMTQKIKVPLLKKVCIQKTVDTACPPVKPS